MRLAAQAKGGYYPTPDRVVDLVADLIQTPTGYYHRDRETIRILDPCCGAGDALQRLAERLDRPNAISIETYGVELHRDRAEEAEKRLHRALASDLFATSIANGAFGLLLLNPPYDFDSEDKRTEHAFLTHHHALPGRERAAGLHRSPPAPRGLGPPTCPPTTGGSSAGRSPTLSDRSSTRWCSWATARPTPFPTHLPRAWCWSGRWESLSRCAQSRYTEFTPATTPSGDVLFATRTVDPVAAAEEARRSGLWANTEITDSLWPAGDSRTRR